MAKYRLGLKSKSIFVIFFVTVSYSLFWDSRNSRTTSLQTFDPNSLPLKITVLSADLHIGLVEDLKYIFSQLLGIQVRWIDYSLSVYCRFTVKAECAPEEFTKNVLSFDDMLNHVSSDNAAFGRFRRWAEGFFSENSVDIVFCAHPPITCRLYLPFLSSNTYLIMWQAVTLGSTNNPSVDLNQWFVEYERIFQHPNALVLVNNQYHQMEVEYQLGLRPLYQRNLCLYARNAGGVFNDSHSSRKLVQISRQPWPKLAATTMNSLFQTYLSESGSNCRNNDLIFVDFEAHNAGFASYAEVKAVVYMPYASSLMSLFEMYALNIPIFTPSLDYKIALERVHAVDLSWGWYVSPGRTVPVNIPSPVDPSENARRYWLNKSDFISLPHLQHFNDYNALCHQLCNADLDTIARLMKSQNDMDLHSHNQFWSSFLNKRYGGKTPKIM